VAIGEKASSKLHDIHVGPVCSASITYKSGTVQTLPTHTFASEDGFQWTWTVPSTAGVGTATITTKCTWGGDKLTGAVDFEVTA
jgi:hypothetical protein